MLRAGRGKCQLNLQAHRAPDKAGVGSGLELPVTPALDITSLSTWGTAGQAGVKAHFIAEEEKQAWQILAQLLDCEKI